MMLMRYKLTHRTKYSYLSPVNTYHSLVCLQPRTLAGQICHDFNLHITPTPLDLIARIDFFGNTLHYFSIDISHQKLIVEAQSDIESLPKMMIDPRFSLSCQEAHTFIWSNRSVKVDLLQYILPSPLSLGMTTFNHLPKVLSVNLSLYLSVSKIYVIKFSKNLILTHILPMCIPPFHCIKRAKRSLPRFFPLSHSVHKKYGFPSTLCQWLY
ncbi:MAG: transglutaminase N-terminal domain-containing protein [Spirosomataceae bacterium]